MKLSIWAIPVLALSSLALPALPRTEPRVAERLRFAVEAGTQLTRSFEMRGDYQTALVEIDVSGMEVQVPEIELGASWTRRIEVSDQFEKMREGAPALLVRRFDTIEHELRCTIDIEGEAMTHKEDGPAECGSGLDGVSVRFEWNEETESFDKRLEGEEGEPELLEGLVEDMDLRALLPEDEVEPGERWEVEPEAFLSVLAPGGELGVRLGRGETDRSPELPAGGLEPRMAGSLDVMLGEPSGDSEISATFVELKEIDGRRIAVIALAAELATSAEAIERFELWMDEYEPEAQGELEVDIESAELDFECSLEGQLLWDVAAGHARSLELAGDSMLTLTRAAAISVDGEDVHVAAEIELEGKLAIRASFE